ncbi:hypothetical protein NQ317_005832 [Molorchus minor]|uniref:Thiolase N-terminal domain-containing protein n=1 Tax=Molorchus minor TaxID=1323400 RepID=A0ABQ9JZ52_9CUCU|nr:hypothetical protein NQ317_005832 [Molorchus minor]
MTGSQVYIVSGCRTAIGSFQGQFEKFSAADLGTIAIAEAIKRATLKPEDIEQVIMGQVLTAGQGQNPARQSALQAKIPVSSPAYVINMLCGSGLKHLQLIGIQKTLNADGVWRMRRLLLTSSQNVQQGLGERYLGGSVLNPEDVKSIQPRKLCTFAKELRGGQESMSRAQHSTYLRGSKLGHLNLSDTLISDGLTDAFNNIHMGNTAEHLAKKYNISREAQDEYSCNSQIKVEKATQNNFFDKEIVGVPDKRTGKLINKDEFPKPGTTIQNLSKLRPCFESSGTVTAGNASGKTVFNSYCSRYSYFFLPESKQ